MWALAQDVMGNMSFTAVREGQLLHTPQAEEAPMGLHLQGSCFTRPVDRKRSIQVSVGVINQVQFLVHLLPSTDLVIIIPLISFALLHYSITKSKRNLISFECTKLMQT